MHIKPTPLVAIAIVAAVCAFVAAPLQARSAAYGGVGATAAGFTGCVARHRY